MLKSVTECYRVLKSVTECYRVLQSVTEYYSVLQNITETNLAHLLGPTFGLVFISMNILIKQRIYTPVLKFYTFPSQVE